MPNSGPLVTQKEETRLDAFEMKGLRKILWVSSTSKKTNERVLKKAGVKRELLDTVKARELTVSILWSHHEERSELPGNRDNAKNNARCTKARKTTHGLDGQHQDVDRTLRGSQSESHRTEVSGESTSIVWPTLASRTAKEQNSPISQPVLSGDL